ncbi:ankyrin [Choiromyces venosus 120613-1]|uniref:Ankyrin n=1 Tax=Choiromyces venosus 120613-1 TaxID=1336337 RepID=A0A3N4J0T8_9PEZI|nr:ankyrin [Choiromyces venosus 120613-1]
MSFLVLPNELLIEICISSVLEISDIASVVRTSRFLRDLLVWPLRSQISKWGSDKYSRKALYHAAERREASEIQTLLDDGILDVVHEGSTLLHRAVSTLGEEGLTTISNCGVDRNTVDNRGRTPLICATTGKHLSAIRALTHCPSVDVNRPWIYEDFAALHLAVCDGDLDVLSLLLACPRIAVNQIRTLGQVEKDPPVIKREQQNLDTELESARRGMVYLPMNGGKAPLHLTVNQRDLTFLRILLEDDRLDVNVQDRMGETALRSTVSCGHI